MEKYEEEIKRILNMVGRNLRLYRSKLGLTQHGLAEKSGVSRQNISNIEIGATSPSISTLVLLSAALRVNVKDFFKEKS